MSRQFPFAAHALSDTLLAEHPLVLLVLILPTLIRVENQACSGRDLCKRLVKHGGYHAEYRTIRYGVTDQIATVQIENRGQIELFSKQAELRHIRDPFLIRLFGMEIPDLADLMRFCPLLPYKSDTSSF